MKSASDIDCHCFIALVFIEIIIMSYSLPVAYKKIIKSKKTNQSGVKTKNNANSIVYHSIELCIQFSMELCIVDKFISSVFRYW